MIHTHVKIALGQNRVWHDTVWDTKHFTVIQRIESSPGFVQYKVVQNGRFEIVSADLIQRFSDVIED